jgi:CRP/FNR family transcriptional regulator, cyclic AMP receptor protein
MKPKLSLNPEDLLDRISEGGSTLQYKKGQVIFSQGEPADALFSIRKGKIKLTIVSKQDKVAVIAILAAGEFIGEACLVGQAFRMASAAAITDCTVVRVPKPSMIRLLQEDPALTELFLSYVLTRNIRIEEDLVDQLFNSSEKRLARILLLLANFGKEGKPELVIPNISQETLAGLVGTTRSRVSFFMNRFRKLGFIHYNGGLRIHSSLLNVILHD